MFKKILISFLILFAIGFMLIGKNQVFAQDSLGEQIKKETDTIAGENTYATAEAKKKSLIDVYQFAIGLITSFLGVMFFILTIVAGIQWMTAGGNDEQITKAKGNFKNGIIGITIILAAYIITVFVLSNLSTITGVITGF